MRKYMLISAGCAECRWDTTDPLVTAKLFDTLEEAKEASWMKDPEWKEHPQGGWFAVSGQGDDWILEVTAGVSLKPLKE